MGLCGTSALGLLGGCGAIGGEPALPPAGTIGKAAFLAPLSGPQSSVGQMMRAAASLGGNDIGPGAEVAVYDSGGSEEQAVAAAQAAVAGGAQMLLGPLLSGQSRAVAAAVGRVPVVALTNDSTVAGGNLFVFGITPLQSARAVIGFAATRGKRRVGVVVPSTAFGQLHAAAAAAVGAGVGASVLAPVVTDTAAGLVDRLRSDGTLPDAVYLPVVGGAFTEQAAVLKAAGIQILGSDQWSAIIPYRTPALLDAWFAAPDPIRYEAFALAFEEQSGGEAGVLAGLAFDAVEMARLLGRLGQQNRAGLLRDGGFDGVLGPYRFTEGGQCDRALAVLGVQQGATVLIGATGA
ncbi:penicillin-binding protein activator [Loktanella sp. M215]|uniref:penicillin-binding protein activator n=1 Tax=Loktanella sp. M215 TaxID=2675431 RepID=UPI0023515A1E|nr:penicillin-binding protein activator [Loktanella sp. M215]